MKPVGVIFLCILFFIGSPDGKIHFYVKYVCTLNVFIVWYVPDVDVLII